MSKSNITKVKCQFCQKVFPTMQKYNEHIKEINDKIDKESGNKD